MGAVDDWICWKAIKSLDRGFAATQENRQLAAHVREGDSFLFGRSDVSARIAELAGAPNHSRCLHHSNSEPIRLRTRTSTERPRCSGIQLQTPPPDLVDT